MRRLLPLLLVLLGACSDCSNDGSGLGDDDDLVPVRLRLDSVAPATGPLAGGTWVTLTGAAF
jgi:hypothetical protein